MTTIPFISLLNRSIQFRILSGFVSFIFIIIFVTWLADSNLKHVITHHEIYKGIKDEQRLTLEIKGNAIELQRLLLVYKETASREIAKRFTETYAAVLGQLKAIAPSINDPQRRNTLDRMRDHVDEYAANFNIVVTERELRKTLINEQFQTRYSKLLKELDDINNTLIDLNAKPETSLIQNITENLLLVHNQTLQFLRKPDFILVNTIKTTLDNTIISANNFQSALPGFRQQLDMLSKYIEDYKKTVLTVAQTTRGYLYLTNVVMTGSAHELINLSEHLDTITQKLLNELEQSTGEEIRSTRTYGFSLFLLAVIVGLFLALRFSKGLTQPVGELTDVFQQLSDGKSVARIPGMKRVDEFGEMARAADVFRSKNNEVTRLLEHVEKLNEDLEQQVTDRTQEFVRTNAFLDSVIENIPLMVFIKDSKDLCFIRVNKAAEDLTGVCRSELIGKSDLDLFPPEQAGFFLNKDHEVLENGQIVNIENEEILTKNKGLRYLHTIKVPILDEQGNPLYLLGISEDITERKKIEADLQQTKEAAEAANVSKSQFLAHMSHELRTPLNAIIGYSEMLAEEADESNQIHLFNDLKRIESSGQHLLALINDILDLSKIEAGKMDVILEYFPVQELIHEVTSTMQSMVKKNHNDFSIHYECGTVMMHSDSQKIKQILFNLLSNAAKFTADGEITLTVRSVEENTSQARLEFIVSDDGIGMDAEQLERVFSPFTQADNNTTRKYGGTGLGLAITEKFCEMLNGEIHVNSKPGEGTTFTVSLPIESPSSQSASSSSKEYVSELPQQSHSKETLHISTTYGESDADLILVIDDDTNARELLSLHLAKLDFHVVTADNGMQGINLARELKPQAIILDLMMPHMSGWAVLQILKDDTQLADIPVILCSMMTDQMESGYTLGATDYLVKPVDQNRLQKILRRYCSSPPCCVMVVEDDTATQELVVRTARKQGWQVITAINGLVALKQLEIQIPDMILLDLMMPEMDGFQLIETIRKHPDWRKIPVIIMTAKDLTVEDHTRLDDYVEVILEKGQYDLHELVEQITRQIETVVPAATN